MAARQINVLIVRCCAQDPKERPTFEEVMSELCGVCKVEVEDGNFLRHQDSKAATDESETIRLAIFTNSGDVELVDSLPIIDSQNPMRRSTSEALLLL